VPDRDAAPGSGPSHLSATAVRVATMAMPATGPRQVATMAPRRLIPRPAHVHQPGIKLDGISSRSSGQVYRNRQHEGWSMQISATARPSALNPDACCRTGAPSRRPATANTPSKPTSTVWLVTACRIHRERQWTVDDLEQRSAASTTFVAIPADRSWRGTIRTRPQRSMNRGQDANAERQIGQWGITRYTDRRAKRILKA